MGRVAIEMGKPYLYQQLALGNTVELLNSGNYQFLISQNTSYQHVKKIARPYKAFHVIRDPRDIVVSAYFSYKKTHAIRDWSQLRNLRDKLRAINMEEGLLEIMKFNATFFKYMSNWNFNDPNIYEIKFEGLTQQPALKLTEMFKHLGLLDDEKDGMNFFGAYNRLVNKIGQPALAWQQVKINTKAFDNILERLSFQNLAQGRSTGSENINSHYRKGESGDWQNHFTERHKDYFKTHFGSLLIELGYEKDLNW